MEGRKCDYGGRDEPTAIYEDGWDRVDANGSIDYGDPGSYGQVSVDLTQA